MNWHFTEGLNRWSATVHQIVQLYVQERVDGWYWCVHVTLDEDSKWLGDGVSPDAPHGKRAAVLAAAEWFKAGMVACETFRSDA